MQFNFLNTIFSIIKYKISIFKYLSGHILTGLLFAGMLNSTTETIIKETKMKTK
jgi:hypothetical protein